MESTYKVNGSEIKLRATAATVRNYRNRFGRDFLTDMGMLESRLVVDKTIVSESMDVAEMTAYIMAKDADESVPDSVEEWLNQFDPLFIYKVIPSVLEMWRGNTKSLNVAKKK